MRVAIQHLHLEPQVVGLDLEGVLRVGTQEGLKVPVLDLDLDRLRPGTGRKPVLVRAGPKRHRIQAACRLGALGELPGEAEDGRHRVRRGTRRTERGCTPEE
jgi:hypothetical protein